MAAFNNYFNLFWSLVSFINLARTQLLSDNALPLANLIFITSQFQSKEPRDKIYAILGISNDGDKLPYKPGYIDSEDIVFIETTAFLLSGGQWFTMLSFSGKGRQRVYPSRRYSPRNYPLPSWVPIMDRCQ
jgi:hypothetical protein